jgi:hypothetical protein
VKLTKTTYTFTVLSEAPISPHLDIAGVIRECETGDYVMADVESRSEPLTGEQMAAALYSAGSDPEFFQLDAESNRIE